MRARLGFAFALLLATVCGGCDKGSNEDPPDEVGGSELDAPDDEGTESPPDVPPDLPPDGDCPSVTDPAGDVDGDGVPNYVEDKNLNCRFDAEIVGENAETDFANPDSDGDGLSDGQEDVNKNGVVDGWELNPRSGDSDNDGVPDFEEYNPICSGEEHVVQLSAGAAFSALALPAGFSAVQHAAARGTAFGNAALHAYGLVVATTFPAGGSVGQVNSQNLLAVARGADGALGGADDNVPTIAFSKPFVLPGPWTKTTELPFYLDGTSMDGIRVQADFRFGPGSANDKVASRDPAALRDQMLSAITGQPVSSGESDAACSSISAYWLAMLRNDADTVAKNGGHPALVTVVILACDEVYDGNAELRLLFDDVIAGTVLAPGNSKSLVANGAQLICERLSPQLSGTAVDYLWVIDNSGSMADEQVNVANTATMFMERLRSKNADWRLAVTTTEAYLLFGTPPDTLAHDELVDPATGLRGVGFLTRDDADAAELFADYVSFDADCYKTDENNQPIAPRDANVCGSGWEDGLRAGIDVLRALGSDTRPGYALRPNAAKVVVFLSDEEAQSLKIDEPSVAIEPSDPRWAPLIDGYVADYRELGAKAYAIVGDQPKDQGGICEPLGTLTSAVNGAQYGQSYLAVASALDGAAGSICNTDLGETVRAIIDDTLAIENTYQLLGYPIVPSIRVRVEDDDVPRSDTHGWNYDPISNSLVFNDWPFEAGDRIYLVYVVWEMTPG